MRGEIKLFDVPEIVSIQDMIMKSCSKFKEKTAMEDYFDYPISRVTYGELYNNIIKFGKSLLALGLSEKDHIAVIGENRVQWGIVYLTAMFFNMVIVPVDKSLSENEIMNILYESDTKALIFSGSMERTVCEMKTSLGRIKYFISMDLNVKKEEFLSMLQMMNQEDNTIKNIPEVNPSDLAEIIYTSGSLGRAKGVMLTQKSISSNITAMTSMIKISPGDRFMGILPIHHTYQCTCGFLCPLYAGSSVHFTRSLKNIAEDLKKACPTIMLGAPLLYNKLYDKIEKSISANRLKSLTVYALIKLTDILKISGWNNSKKVVFAEIHKLFGGSMRLLIVGGAAPDPEVSEAFRNFGFNFVQGYGLTETSPILTLNTLKYFKDDSAGLPLPGIKLRINKPDKYGVGEVYAKGDNIMIGYYKNEKTSSESFDGEWFKTGDLGYIDKDGFLHLSGRMKNVIISNSGENVYPEEIEDRLNRSPFIIESMIFGEKDEKHDEIIAARIVPDAEAFIEYAEKNGDNLNDELMNKIISKEIEKSNKDLASFKRIKKFYLRDKEFEKTTTQKIKRHLVTNNLT